MRCGLSEVDCSDDVLKIDDCDDLRWFLYLGHLNNPPCHLFARLTSSAMFLREQWSIQL
jgi:hypothetical protein